MVVIKQSQIANGTNISPRAKTNKRSQWVTMREQGTSAREGV
ncbi:MAG TPA: hypothetical protein VNW73_06675 [Ktedonobacteraceae bacterium]|nr:hypothetical protein [Ktedonobacteraceae bacterium]